MVVFGDEWMTDTTQFPDILTQSSTQPRDEHGYFVESHGGEGALKKLTGGAPLVGLAAESARKVEAELATDGRAAIVQRAAVRLEAVARLFYDAILTATEQGDFEKLALYAQRHGWLQARALSAWEQLRREGRERDSGPTAAQVLDSFKDRDNEQVE
jgi:hypothetical protein